MPSKRARMRKPSNFGSKIQSGSSNASEDRVHSIGLTDDGMAVAFSCRQGLVTFLVAVAAMNLRSRWALNTATQTTKPPFGHNGSLLSKPRARGR